MAYITAAEFKTRLPEFSEVADAEINPFIVESDITIGASWPQEVRQLAQTLYVAHTMVLDGFTSETGTSEMLTSLSGVSRFRIDDLDVSFSDKMVEKQIGDPLYSTPYGRRFAELRKRYFSGGVWAR